MLDALRKTIYAGLGLAVVSREEIGKIVERLVQEGKLKAETGEKLVDELMGDAQEQWRSAQEQLRGAARSAVDSLDIGSRREFLELAERLAALEERVSILEDRPKSSPAPTPTPTEGGES